MTRTHLVLIPAYNPGRLLDETVEGALAAWPDVWVVSDGSTDGSERQLAPRPGLRVIARERNGGKGAAVETGALAAAEAGFTHALVMDADAQHPAARIREFMEASARAPGSLICGLPQFGGDAPAVRIQGRKVSVALVRWETRGRAAADPLFGFRVYPLRPLAGALASTRHARRYDFDPEVAVRLAWAGVPAVNLPAACRYVPRSAGGISHFHYVRDNLRMAAMHTRLILSLLLRGSKGPPP
ncbi:MAG TPA: glycosyltransferase family 2 protein [Opitutaceae bacterium]|jgi:glycosyltransferase involved in cell wall biosynthesis